VSAHNSRNGLVSAVRGVRPFRLLVLLLLSLAAALASDWLRDERVVFPAPLPTFTTVPARP
jgi:hypothetical protein